MTNPIIGSILAGTAWSFTGFALPDVVDGAAAGPVDSGQPEDVDRRTGIEAHRLPGALG